MRTIRITTQAYMDLRDTMLWWGEHRSWQEAARWSDECLEQLQALAEMPHRHSLARENHKCEHELREVHIGIGNRKTHRAVFAVSEDSIEILAVKHFSQNDLQSDL